MANKREINKIVKKAVAGETLRTSLDYNDLKLKGGFHQQLVDELRTWGFKDYETLSRCRVAYGGETHLKKDSIEVNIITSDFLGTFTQVDVS